MNWPRAKTWLIVLFLCVNAFLAYYITTDNIAASYTDSKTIEQTAAMLHRNGITVDIADIPAFLPNLNPIEMENALTDNDALALAVLGSGYVKLTDQSYEKGSKRLFMYGDMIRYENTGTADIISGLTADNAADTVRSLFGYYGFDTQAAESKRTADNNDVYTVVLTQRVDGYPVFDSSFEVTLSKSGISGFVGSWFVPSEEGGMFSSPDNVISAASVLVDFITDPLRVQNGSNAISNISIGYTTDKKDAYHSAATAMPVWCVNTTDGMQYYYDAR